MSDLKKIEDIGYFKADMAIFIMAFHKDVGITHWRDIMKVMDDFIEDWNKDPAKMHEWCGTNG